MLTSFVTPPEGYGWTLEEPRLPRPPEFDGPQFAIQALTLANGTCPAGEFLDALDSSDRRKLDVLFERLGTSGKISNVVILAIGVRKKKNTHRREDIDRAEANRQRFLASEGSGPQ